MNSSEIFENVLAGLPYPDQVKDICFDEVDAIRFTWRSSRYRVSSSLLVEEVGNSMLMGSNESIIFTALLKKTKCIKDFSCQ